MFGIEQILEAVNFLCFRHGMKVRYLHDQLTTEKHKEEKFKPIFESLVAQDSDLNSSIDEPPTA